MIRTNFCGREIIIVPSKKITEEDFEKACHLILKFGDPLFTKSRGNQFLLECENFSITLEKVISQTTTYQVLGIYYPFMKLSLEEQEKNRYI
ncbi:hypothetical protein [Metabacillus arenae]|uniref:Uncharacterized protein n=1 Tax=Metabacillus arenae TaxID=2771434 RepID=A0A926NKG9_9BACI|nr:hypothetical protein [Metabacillus arenae]MBD1381623.1 hypothetical protein [Metabacillus arenae]